MSVLVNNLFLKGDGNEQEYLKCPVELPKGQENELMKPVSVIKNYEV